MNFLLICIQYVYIYVLDLKTCFVFRSRRGDVSVASFRRGRSICLRIRIFWQREFRSKLHIWDVIKLRLCVGEKSLLSLSCFLWTTNREKWGLKHLVNPLNNSYTLYQNEGCNYPDHQEEGDGHDGIGGGSVQLDGSSLDPCYGMGMGMEVILTLL